jgi:hypothetical protein
VNNVEKWVGRGEGAMRLRHGGAGAWDGMGRDGQGWDGTGRVRGVEERGGEMCDVGAVSDE